MKEPSKEQFRQAYKFLLENKVPQRIPKEVRENELKKLKEAK